MIRNNLFADINGQLFQILSAPADLVIEHNTGIPVTRSSGKDVRLDFAELTAALKTTGPLLQQPKP